MATQSAFSRFLSLFNFVSAGRDFLSVWREENPYRLRIIAVSAAATFAIFSTMFGEEHVIEDRPAATWYLFTSERAWLPLA